jgi:AbiV family abortive infection protein
VAALSKRQASEFKKPSRETGAAFCWSAERSAAVPAACGGLAASMPPRLGPQKPQYTLMFPKKLNAYRGPLSAAEIAAGINAANANANRLLEDAQALLASSRYPTAVSLAVLSIEESGKVSILRQLATSTSKAEISAAWKSYRSHTRKNVQWLLPDLTTKGARKLDDFRPLFETDAEHPFILDQIKQLGLYTDCLGNRHWSVPIDVIDEKLARSLVGIAKLLVGKSEITTEEIELWVKHIGAAAKDDFPAMQQALINWYSAMQDADLRSNGINEMERFIKEGVPFPTRHKEQL